MADELATPLTHKIGENEDLTDISLQYYGTTLLWTLIRDRNEPIDPRRLKPGTIITIPGDARLFWKRQIELILKNRNIFHVYFPFHGLDEKFANSPVMLPLIPSGSLFGMPLPVKVEGLCQKTTKTVDDKEIALEQKAFENDDFLFEWSADPSTVKKVGSLDANITIFRP